MDIMHAIMDIEQKAQAIVSSTDELKEVQNMVLEKELAQKKEDMEQRLKEQCQRIEEDSFILRREKMEKLEERYGEKLKTLDDKCQNDKAKWVDSMVGAIVGEYLK